MCEARWNAISERVFETDASQRDATFVLERGSLSFACDFQNALGETVPRTLTLANPRGKIFAVLCI